MKENYIVRFIVPGTFEKIIVVLVIIIGAILTFKGFYISILFVLMGITALSSYTGVDFDFTKNIYREYLCVLGIKNGKTKPLPKLQYICLRDAVFKVKNEEYGTYSTDDNYEVSLVFHNQLKIELFYSYDKKETIQFTKELENKYKCRIEDLTKEKLLAVK